ncbi:hypothetical protein AJ79_09980 [Helicocarpus griseus UAMH5409]|uniref:Tafazzin n=1 Tax=Helicocarpus griseus UAMH5409 TaxID=1447875 RepID=A0A2B7WGA9_9EURO|nr:hypothetical protein AJ79_09980 [Helicocarpus griseus UAMH5409]
MPKKHHKPLTPKPTPTVHPSLTSSTGSASNKSAKAGEGRSVNDLIRHLRRTQLPKSDEAAAGPSWVAPRSVHPSIRNLLELPEPPPPRPRSGIRPVGERGDSRVRRTAGPAAPMSWLVPNDHTEDGEHAQDADGDAEGSSAREWNSRLDRLPGAIFPARGSLQHMVMKSMALNWDAHLLYDGAFLAELPTTTKQLLLSYIATYTDHASMEVGMQGLRPLFLDRIDDDIVETHTDVIRLDLGSALGQWMTFKQLTREIKGKDTRTSHTPKPEDSPPTSWEEEAAAADSPSTIPATPTQPVQQRFHNLKYLSLAHPTSREASWPALVTLLTHLSTITHLSLAYWPFPTLSPKSLATTTRDHIKQVSPFIYGGLNIYQPHRNWAEPARILRRLSKATYCLKWLDLEGCTAWLPALSWTGPDDEGNYSSTAGPEWNGAWRGVEWLGMAPGWFPDISDVEDSYAIYERDKVLAERASRGLRGQGGSARARCRYREMRRPIDARNEYRKTVQGTVEVRRQLREIRREAGGRWLEGSLGPVEEEELRIRVCGDFAK